jgi:MFS family permease
VLQTLHRRVEFLTVLRHRDYRIYYLGLLASVTSHQAMIAAQGWLVYDMTGRPAMLGFVAAAQAVPGIVFNLLAGALADRLDPRKIIVMGEGGAALLMALLATLVVTEVVEVWHIITIAFFTGIAVSFDQPARRVIWPALIPRSEYVFGTALNQGVWNGTRVIAPAIAMGIIALVDAITGDARLGAGISLYVIGAGFATMAGMMFIMRMPELKRATGATVFHDVLDGLAFVARNRIFLTLMGLSFAIGYFGLSYQWLLPAYAKDVLGRGPQGLGLLMSASGLGGVIGIFMIASFGRYQSRAWLIGAGAGIMGTAIIGLGIAGELGLFPVALVLVGLAGMMYSVFQIGANTLMNLLVPTELRGRVMGLRAMMWSLSPLGALQAGLIAGSVSTPFAIALGGAAVMVITGLVFALSRQLRNVGALVEEADAREAAVEKARA